MRRDAAASLARDLRRHRRVLSSGPLAIILVEDSAVIEETLDHHLNLKFRHLLVLSPTALPLPPRFAEKVTNLIWDCTATDAHIDAVNAVIRVVPAGTWLYYCFNAEFLFFPFCEYRSIGEMLAFHQDERRDAMLSYVIDLYAGDLHRAPDAVDLQNTLFDRSGYFALARPDTLGQPRERQLDFHGGLRWRFEEHLPASRRHIDRIALFRTAPGLWITAAHRFNLEEYNTYSCPWHHNLTAAIASFRAAKALKTNPGSGEAIHDFRWRHSTAFAWQSQQLLDLGLIEPGQWF